MIFAGEGYRNKCSDLLTRKEDCSVIPNHAVQFRFNDPHNAAMAYATLNELGYQPVKSGNAVHIHLDRGDLTSALEIAMAHGGQLAGEAALEESAVIDTAYEMDAIPIPAHTVNEDWPDHYATATADEQPGHYAMEAAEELGSLSSGRGSAGEDEDGDGDGLFEPDAGAYGFFSGDVRA